MDVHHLGSVWRPTSRLRPSFELGRFGVRFNIVGSRLAIRQIGGIRPMATVKLSDEALLAFFQSHRSFRDRLASIVGAMGNLQGDLGEADAAEERLVEEMRLLGREALQGWADERI